MKKIVLIIISLLVVMALIFIFTKKKNTVHTSGTESKPASSISVSNTDEKHKTSIDIYFPSKANKKLIKEKRLIASESLNSLESKLKTALTELKNGPISNDLLSPFPDDAKPLTVKVDNEIAVVDMSADFIAKTLIDSNKDRETLMLKSIVNTLTSNGVNKVRFTVDNKEVPEIKGHVNFKGDFEFDNTI